MSVRQDQDSPVPSQNETASALFGINTLKAELQDDEHRDDREEIWNRRLRSLEEWVCVLLIKNQELRMSLRNDIANSNPRKPSCEKQSITSEGGTFDSPP